jgi:uncharacterized membrane protein
MLQIILLPNQYNFNSDAVYIDSHSFWIKVVYIHSSMKRQANCSCVLSKFLPNTLNDKGFETDSYLYFITFFMNLDIFDIMVHQWVTGDFVAITRDWLVANLMN